MRLNTVISSKGLAQRPLFLVLGVALSILTIGRAVKAQQSSLESGMMEIEITPSEAGYPHYRGPSTGAHDPLFAKAVIFQQGEEKVALVVGDLLWIERDLSVKARRRIEAITGIPFQNIIIAGTHSHTSPAYHPNIRELTGTLRPPFDTQQDTGKADAYPKELEDGIVNAVIKAYEQREEVVLEVFGEEVNDLAYNRRFIMKNGKLITNPGRRNPSIREVEGPTDPELAVVMIQRKKDKHPIGTVSNFSLHADTFGGTAFSADYPGFLANNLQKHFHKDFVSLFATGACGNINHVDVSGTKEEGKSSSDIGEILSSAILQMPSKFQKVIQPDLKAIAKVIYVPIQHFTPEELEWAIKETDAPALYEETDFLERRRRLKIRSLERIRRTEAVPPTIGDQPWRIPLEVQVFQVSEDLAIVGLPGEVFVDLGLAIKENSPYKNTIVVELTHSHIAYVPTKEAFTRGGYETVNSRLAPGGGEMLADTAIALLQEIHQKQ
ncbi:neutral/alkaline non-lysosomal ceramidase N-terminal domain-containing protein [uncultured Cyclobacterium sp.]|uniref:neutral/alkaline non-lysosomal ceramidase N-terminal domain-containing protein n=1 Tax=uncultured Cyclobacterium sp. TaxID=453820 RepID=UPI0030EC1400|tara:strand:+ start:78361 stop:79845 length:1485 start_codon:yes stop_codon:yes gene_type:complete